ncbi:MAG: hypothetical protein MUQ99_03600, partial [Pseudomonadales bacterium]|nr:hypothetical protein [Pseudomonadales bacterium]
QPGQIPTLSVLIRRSWYVCPGRNLLVLDRQAHFIASPVLVLQFIGRRTLSSLDGVWVEPNCVTLYYAYH